MSSLNERSQVFYYMQQPMQQRVKLWSTRSPKGERALWPGMSKENMVHVIGKTEGLKITLILDGAKQSRKEILQKELYGIEDLMLN